MSMQTYDIVIIGGGIVGAACALECAREKMSVCVIEADIPSGGATGAGMGHIVVMDDSEAQFALTRYSRKLWNELAENHNLPAGVEFVRAGTIWVAADEEEMQEVRRKERYYTERGVPVEVLDPRQLAEAEPNLRPGLAGALLVPSDSVIYPPAAAQYFLDCAKALGVHIRCGVPVRQIVTRGVVLGDGSSMAARIIVNAAGAASPLLTPGIDVKKRKGHLVITDRYPGFVRHQLVELGYLKSAHAVSADSVAFNVQPRITGQILIGSSRQYQVEEKGIDMPILTRMIERAGEYMPSIGSLQAIRTWTGFRAATPDKLPLIGQYPGKDWLYLATGHEGLGITTSLGTAKLLADQIVRRAPAISAQPYLPSRAIREGIPWESAHA